MTNQKNIAGFTFVEVMVAMLIFVLAALSAMNLVKGSVRATVDTREMSVATWLLQQTMVELETRLETKGFDKGCDKKKEGKYPEPYSNYSYISFCTEIKVNFSQTDTLAPPDGTEADDKITKENQMQKLILDTATEYLSKAMREIHVEVYWNQGTVKRVVDATTHVVRYDLPLQLPGIAAIPQGQSGEDSSKDSKAGDKTSSRKSGGQGT